MKTYEELIQQWNSCVRGGQVLVDSTHPLRMFLNVNENAEKEILIPVKEREKRFKQTIAIGIANYDTSSGKYFAIRLLLPELETEFVCLCFDLIESSRNCTTENAARKVVFDTLKKWYSLLADSRREILPEREIRGLFGELQYMVDELGRGVEDQTLVDGWTIHKDASRDFIFESSWSEIKTIEPTKDYVTISSIEQLDHDCDGRLIVYRAEKTELMGMGGESLNDKVEEVRNKLGFQAELMFNQKLLAKGYAYNSLYDDILLVCKGKEVYIVDESFPRISKDMIHDSIVRATYDIRLNSINNWRSNG